jgi:acetyl-CoA carboxylase biotin carboxyl carrier protein
MPPSNSDKNGKLDTGLIRELAAILREADLGEIEIEQGGLRIKVVKPEARTVHVAAPAGYVAPGVASAVPQSPAAPAAAPPARKVTAAADHPGAVKAPMVGTVYLAPDEESPPFVKVGDTVAAGQTLMLIEAMKTFNPIPAAKPGKVVQILVENQQPVEFGQPLVIIE